MCLVYHKICETGESLSLYSIRTIVFMLMGRAKCVIWWLSRK